MRKGGEAYMFCPDAMPITCKTTDYKALCGAYELGLAQCERELPAWRAWLDTRA